MENYFSDGDFIIKENGKKELTMKSGHERSITFKGIANAMADQWTDYYLKK
ncbi:MAG: hypothetical protein LBS50_10460 [Prevotellaceae bacterium]|jgi:hypothetical protein|nr:hypothetical protein [Prevotellaceae bacterium]